MENISKALVKFQGMIPDIPKDKKVQFKNVKYSYAELSTILKAIRKPLKECGLGFNQDIAGAQMITTIFHESGESISTHTPMLEAHGKMQDIGSVQTYARRYGIQNALGIATEEDTDCTHEMKQSVKAPHYKKFHFPMNIGKTIKVGMSFEAVNKDELEKLHKWCSENWKNPTRDYKRVLDDLHEFIYA